MLSVSIFASSTALILAGLLVDHFYLELAEDDLELILQGELETLVSAVELNARGELISPELDLSAKMLDPDSGLFAAIFDMKDQSVWKSPTLKNREIRSPGALSSGKGRFYRAGLGQGDGYFFGRRLTWELETGVLREFDLVVATDVHTLTDKVFPFRLALMISIIALLALLFFALRYVIDWGIRPLGAIGEDLRAIQAGRITELKPVYATELNELSQAINHLLQRQRESLDAYRKALQNLAHSLKTPLAALQTLETSDEIVARDREVLDTQLERMGEIVEYQLRRASFAGGSMIGSRVSLLKVFERVATSLQRRSPTSRDFHSPRGSLRFNVSRG